MSATAAAQETFSPATVDEVPAVVTEEMARAAIAAMRPVGEIQNRTVGSATFPVCTAGAPGAPTAVFIHGLGHDMSDFAGLFARRPAGQRAVALDLPGFGLASLDGSPGAIDRLVDATLAVVNAEEGPVRLVGSSLGGHVALLAALRGAKIKDLLLFAPGGLERVGKPTQMIARAYYSERALLRRSESEIIANAKKIFAVHNADTARLAARKLAVHRSPLRAAYAKPFAQVVDEVFPAAVLTKADRLAIPTRTVLGAKDPVVPAKGVERFCTARGEPLLRLDGIGHVPMLECPDRAAELVYDTPIGEPA